MWASVGEGGGSEGSPHLLSPLKIKMCRRTVQSQSQSQSAGRQQDMVFLHHQERIVAQHKLAAPSAPAASAAPAVPSLLVAGDEDDDKQEGSTPLAAAAAAGAAAVQPPKYFMPTEVDRYPRHLSGPAGWAMYFQLNRCGRKRHGSKLGQKSLHTCLFYTYAPLTSLF